MSNETNRPFTGEELWTIFGSAPDGRVKAMERVQSAIIAKFSAPVKVDKQAAVVEPELGTPTSDGHFVGCPPDCHDRHEAPRPEAEGMSEGCNNSTDNRGFPPNIPSCVPTDFHALLNERNAVIAALEEAQKRYLRLSAECTRLQAVVDKSYQQSQERTVLPSRVSDAVDVLSRLTNNQLQNMDDEVWTAIQTLLTFARQSQRELDGLKAAVVELKEAAIRLAEDMDWLGTGSDSTSALESQENFITSIKIVCPGLSLAAHDKPLLDCIEWLLQSHQDAGCVGCSICARAKAILEAHRSGEKPPAPEQSAG